VICGAYVQVHDLDAGLHSAMHEFTKLLQSFLASRSFCLQAEEITATGTKTVFGHWFYDHGDLHRRSSKDFQFKPKTKYFVKRAASAQGIVA
jgi:hypothetical protein